MKQIANGFVSRVGVLFLYVKFHIVLARFSLFALQFKVMWTATEEQKAVRQCGVCEWVHESVSQVPLKAKPVSCGLCTTILN